MFILRLFSQDDPFNQLDARAWRGEPLVIGRDPGADWVIPDPTGEVSRKHCTLTSDAAGASLTDTSSNGVFVGAERQRAPADGAIPLPAGEMIRLGGFLIVVEGASASTDPHHAFDAPFARPILAEPDVSSAALAVPSTWADAGAPRPAPHDGSLLDAFCAGAKLDASQFAAEDPAVIMRRLGEAYRQMVLGLGDLMNERTTLKSGYRMDRTRVGARDNNPFKWMSGQRLAVDLLKGGHDGFLAGPEAVSASFADLKKHLLCVLWGMRAAIGETLDALSPEKVEYGLKGQPFVLRSKGQACWSEYDRRHRDLVQAATHDPDSVLNRAFVAAYQARADELQRKEAQS